jgi:2-keto-3-deoxy-L-rhamnonate aldolase RhmA
MVVPGKSADIYSSCVLLSAKMEANITAVINEYEERVRRTQKMPRVFTRTKNVEIRRWSEQGFFFTVYSVTMLWPLNFKRISS